MSDIVERLRSACVGHPNAKVPWPHRVLHEAADEIARLRSTTADMFEALDEARTALTNERDAFYESVTTVDGEFTDPADGEELAEMDRLLAKVNAALIRAADPA